MLASLIQWLFWFVPGTNTDSKSLTRLNKEKGRELHTLAHRNRGVFQRGNTGLSIWTWNLTMLAVVEFSATFRGCRIICVAVQLSQHHSNLTIGRSGPKQTPTTSGQREAKAVVLTFIEG